ncbi:hypothetical protein [Mucilaginibacter sp. HD30]
MKAKGIILNSCILLSLFLLLILQSCTLNTAYKKDLWVDGDSGFPSQHRESMLQDLTKNYKLKGLTKTELFNLLGPSDHIENNYVCYNIIVDYGSDIDPVYTKTLEFNLVGDSVVNSFSVIEWKK